MNVKIVDNLFSHAKYSTDFQESKYIKWDRTPVNKNDKLVIYTDNSLNLVDNKIETKIAWLLESPMVSKSQQNWIKNNSNKFDIIFTSNSDLLDIGEKSKFLPVGGCWIKLEDQKIWNKNKLISIIASSKSYTDGHMQRQNVIKNIHKMDVYGRGHNFIPYKLKGLKDYMFSIVIENTKKDYYFTEKLIDCFMTGVIPIYWGCPSISHFFNGDGIITFDNIRELDYIVSNLNVEIYKNKIHEIKDNFEKAKEYLIAEDYMYEKYLKNYI